MRSDERVIEPRAPTASGARELLGQRPRDWQSEFLQLASFVILATYFIHRGLPQSRDGSDELKEDVKAIKRKLSV